MAHGAGCSSLWQESSGDWSRLHCVSSGEAEDEGCSGSTCFLLFLWDLGPKPWELDCHIQVRLHVSYLSKIITHRYGWRPAYQIIFHWDSWRLDSQVTPDWVKLIINKSRPIHLGRFSFSVKKKS